MQNLLRKFRPLILLCFPGYFEATRDNQRRILLVIAGTLIACSSVLPVTPMLIYLGSYLHAMTTALSVIPMLATLVILRSTRSTAFAGHYLTLVVLIALMADLGPDNGFSVVAMLAIPVLSSHIIGAKAGAVWTIITIAILAFISQGLSNQEVISGYALAVTTAIMAGLIGIGSVIIDIVLSTESNRSVASANRLEVQQEKLRIFLDEMFPGFLEIQDDEIVFESEGIEALADKKLGSLNRRRLEELVHPIDYITLQEKMVSSKDTSFTQELRFQNSEGHWVWLELYAISEQRHRNWLFALRDFTDEHESRRRRENAERLQSVGLLAAGIAHDFNNLLTVIVGFSEQFPESDEKKHVIDAATKASELANRLVIFGEPDTGSNTSIDLSTMIKNWEPLIVSILGEEITFSCDNKTDTAWVVGNESQLQQILLNIVKNAKEAMLAGGAFR